MNLKIFKNNDDLNDALAKDICESSKTAIKERGQFNFVLSGGSSPKKLYELLASKAYRHKIEWDKTYFFFGDERFVPEKDSQRNSLMAKQTLFSSLKIAKSQIFKVDTTGSPEESAENYYKTIKMHFQNEPIAFDFVILGLGDNAHTASLFPYTEVLETTEATIKSVFVEEVDMYRITMTAPLINQAKKIVFLVYGKGKAEAVFHVLDDKDATAQQYPARLIDSTDKKVEWYLDTAAASDL